MDSPLAEHLVRRAVTGTGLYWKLGTDLLARAVASRHNVQAGVPGEADIVDPMGKRLRGIRRCADEIQGAIDRILKPIQSTRGVVRSVGARH